MLLIGARVEDVFFSGSSTSSSIIAGNKVCVLLCIALSTVACL